MSLARPILLLLLLPLLAGSAHARPRKPVPVPAPQPVIVVPLLAPQATPANPLAHAPREQRQLGTPPLSILPRFENLPLWNGASLTLDRSLRFRFDLATLLQQAEQPKDTYSLTVEAQTGSTWLWLTYHLPAAPLPQPVAK
jgi:hypothetical protein